jgi:hypothetical protein
VAKTLNIHFSRNKDEAEAIYTNIRQKKEKKRCIMPIRYVVYVYIQVYGKPREHQKAKYK